MTDLRIVDKTGRFQIKWVRLHWSVLGLKLVLNCHWILNWHESALGVLCYFTALYNSRFVGVGIYLAVPALVICIAWKTYSQRISLNLCAHTCPPFASGDGIPSKVCDNVTRARMPCFTAPLSVKHYFNIILKCSSITKNTNVSVE